MSKFKIGDKVVDRDGHYGTITLVTNHQGSTWYDVRFERGCAVRYFDDLMLEDQYTAKATKWLINGLSR